VSVDDGDAGQVGLRSGDHGLVALVGATGLDGGDRGGDGLKHFIVSLDYRCGLIIGHVIYANQKERARVNGLLALDGLLNENDLVVRLEDLQCVDVGLDLALLGSGFSVLVRNFSDCNEDGSDPTTGSKEGVLGG
jgi:hypothetical protein